MLSLNVIGAGRVGRSLAYCCRKTGFFQIGGIINRSSRSTDIAVDYIGGGAACKSMKDMSPTDALMIGVTDGEIFKVVKDAYAADLVRTGGLVFHLSGPLSSAELEVFRNKYKAKVASLHLIKSFEAPIRHSRDLSGIYASVEGDDEAVMVLSEMLKSLDIKPIRISASHKILYHSASVFACNYLTALFDIALDLMVRAGIDRPLARQALIPLVKGTVSNLEEVDTPNALTGPVARADIDLIARQSRAIAHLDERYDVIYRELGMIALDLTRRAGIHPSDCCDEMAVVLDGPPTQK